MDNHSSKHNVNFFPVCSVCGVTEARFVEDVRDWFLHTSSEFFSLWSCQHCRGFFLYPLPAPRIVRKAYPNGYWWNFDSTGYLARSMENYRRWSAYPFLQWIHKTASLLPYHADGSRSLRVAELGCGTGMLLTVGRERLGWDVTGFDNSFEAARIARERYGLSVIVADLEEKIPDLSSFDVVILAHVLEHVRDPARLLRNIFQQTDPRVLLVLQVPHAQSLGAKLWGVRWRGFDAPRHLRIYSRNGLATQLASAGLVIQKEKCFSWRDDPYHLAATFFPWGDPVALAVQSHRGHVTPFTRLIRTFLFIGITFVFMPLAWLGSFVGKGETLQVMAVRRS